ncbi:MAG: TonB-dependent receptor [Acidobacteriia bacterium]|nr:TonB-dependent receptor [Terriglobia bacterium]
MLGSSFRRLLLGAVLAAPVGTLSVPVLRGQTQSINGSIQGRIADPAGAPVPDAQVTVKNESTGFTRSQMTNMDGYYAIPNLPLGTYTVEIQKMGFQAERHTGVAIDAGVEAVIDAKLTVGAVSTEIEVAGGAPVIDPAQVNIGRTIGHVEVDNLPLTSRNPYNFVIFQPGMSGHPNAELGIPRTLNTNGLLDRVNYQMDGMVDTETDRYGLRLFAVSDIYVREVQTVSNSFAPEYGFTAGDIYNVITNSGTNSFNGEFYFIGRPPGANARTILLASNKPAAAIDLHDWAFNAGGPIKKDKLFVFGGYEHLLRGTPTPTTIDPGAAAQIGLPSSLLATAPTVQHVQFLNLRADWVINQNNQLFIRYDYFRNEYPFNTQNGGLNALNAAVDFHDRAHIGGLQLLTTFSPTTLNEFRASEPYRNEHHVSDPLTGAGPEIIISGVATFNGTQNNGDRFAEKIPSFSDSITKISGRHTFKGGFGFQENNDNQVGDIYSSYTFSSVANYLSAKSGANPYAYTQFATVLGVPGAAYKSYFYDFFVQDSWRARPNFTLIYGVRWDRFQAPSGMPNAPFVWTRNFRTPNRDWAPRLGFAWTVTPKTVIRASSGLFYEAPATNTWYNAFAYAGSTQAFTDTFAPSQAGAPAFPAVFNYLPGATLPSPPTIITVTPNFKNAYTVNANFQIQREITHNDSLTLGFVHTGARDLEYLRDTNLINPTGFLADGRPVFSTAVNAATRLYPQFNGIDLEDVGAVSNYNALVVSWWHRFSAGVQISANYTWSHSISDAPDANSFEQNVLIQDPYSRAYDRGNSLVNRPQAFNMSAYFSPKVQLQNRFWHRLANDNELALLANLAVGDEQNETANLNLSNEPGSVGPVSTSILPAFVSRDSLRTGNIYQVDMRYTRTLFAIHERFRTKILAEGNNVFNTRNVTTINTKATVNPLGIVTAQPTLAPTSTVLEGRLIQLGIRADW